MNDDWGDCVTVSVILMLMIIICLQAQEYTLIYKDWNNLKCNPIVMVLNSMTQNTQDSITAFNQCVNLVPPAPTAAVSVPQSSINQKSYYGLK